MLNIDIVDVYPDGRLKFKVNGNDSSNGNGEARRGWSVHWKVKSNIEVQSIINIVRKSGSIDIFRDDRPSAQDPHGKHWMGTVDSTAAGEYWYSIHWKDRANRVRIHDPKISVNPRFADVAISVVGGAVLGLAGLLVLKLLFRTRRTNRLERNDRKALN